MRCWKFKKNQNKNIYKEGLNSKNKILKVADPLK